MKPEDARYALKLLSHVGKAVALLGDLPDLAPVDYALVQQMAGSAVLCANRMDVIAHGQSVASVLTPAEATRLAEEPETRRIQ